MSYGDNDSGYWDSYLKVLMRELVHEIKKSPTPKGWMPEEINKAWIEAFDHLLKGCPEKNDK